MSKNFSPNAYNQQSFGAAGFDIIASDSTNVVVANGDWVSISAINGNKVNCILGTSIGDNFSTDGTNPSSITASSTTLGNKGIDLISSQTVFGEFNQIKLNASSSKTVYLIAYRRALG